MAQTRQEAIAAFTAYVARLEEFARRRPGLYRLRVFLLACLGYAFLAFIFLIALALAAAIIGGVVWIFKGGLARLLIHSAKFIIMLAIPVLAFTWVMFTTFVTTAWRLLWFRFPAPGGLKLQRGLAPRLFQLVERLKSSLNSAPIHEILVDHDFNAGVVQIPRLGLLGWHKNYLVVGLPLLQALSPDQFKAILAHEIGHISGNHSRFNVWVDSTWMTWQHLIESLEQTEEPDRYRFILGFFNWYAPLFLAHQFALKRGMEYEADRCAKRVAGLQHCAEGLIATTVKGRFLGNVFWPSIQQQASTGKVAIFSSMRHAMHQGIAPEQATQWLQEAMQEDTSIDDTHPCLRERLEAIGYFAQASVKDPVTGQAPLAIPPPPTETAADFYLGKTSEEATQFLDQVFAQILQQQAEHSAEVDA